MANSYIKHRVLTSVPITIPQGGTGATTKTAAQTNLGIHPKMCINGSTLLNKKYSSSEATYTSTQDSIMFAVGTTTTSTSAGIIKNGGATYRIYDESSTAGEDEGSVRVTIAAGIIKSGETVTYQRAAIMMCKLRA